MQPDTSDGLAILALRSRATTMVDAELARLRGRLPGLGDQAIGEIAQTVRRVVDGLLDGVTLRVWKRGGLPGNLDYATALCELFDLEPPAADRRGDVPASTEKIVQLR